MISETNRTAKISEVNINNEGKNKIKPKENSNINYQELIIDNYIFRAKKS